MPQRSAAPLVLTVAATLLLAACSSLPEPAPAPRPDASQAPVQTVVEVSPLTGEALPQGRPSHPVLVVKIENTAAGAPQTGLDRADLVVEELVEGGLTRLAAFFYSELPAGVGHVRSVRATDIGIAAPVAGQVVASGGASGTLRKVRDAGITVFSEDDDAPGFSSDPLKVRPYNRLVDLRRVARSAVVEEVPGPYLDWTPLPGTDGGDASAASAGVVKGPAREPAASATVTFSPSTSTRWALDGEQWVRTNGRATKEFRADTLVVMFAEVGDAGYLDPAGNPVPETRMEGSGRAVLLTAAGALETTWTKESADDTLTFATADGAPVTIDPGHAWIELVPEVGGSLSVG